MRCAIIDIGTNSVKFHIGERSPAGAWTQVTERAEITRLGEGLHEFGGLTSAAMQRTCNVLRAMVADAEREQVQKLVAVGTMALRTASNAQEFLDLVRTQCGLPVEVLSGEDESRFSYIAARSSLPDPLALAGVFDTGGGSTEVMFGKAGRITDAVSMSVGALRLTEAHHLAHPVAPARLVEIRRAIAADLSRLATAPHIETLIGVGGAVNTVAAVFHKLWATIPGALHGTHIDRREIDRQISLYARHTTEERRTIVGLPEGRADIILAGVCIISVLMDILHQDQFVVSERGLRHGILLERCSADGSTPDLLERVRTPSTG